MLHDVTDEAVDNWAADTNIFFVVGMGRSGTSFLAEMLNTDRDATVKHEPVRMDFVAYAQAFHHQEEADKYVQLFRKKDIYTRAMASKKSTYGEVNGTLRRHVSALRRAFSGARIIHLVRDGRDVVRSMMSRRTFTWLDPVTAQLYPAKGDPVKNSWHEMSRFEKLCWYWQIDNEFVRRSADATVHFEKLISDYNYFEANVLRPLGLEISQATWTEALTRPKNATRRHLMPHWSEWSEADKLRFSEICGPEMRRSGYELA